MALILFAAALLVRFTFLVVAWYRQEGWWLPPDSIQYVSIGKNWLSGAGLGQYFEERFYPVHHFTPAYPIFAACIISLGGLPFLFGLQVLMSSTLPALVYLAVHRTARLRPYALPVAILLCIEPVSIIYSGIAMSETLFCFVLSLALLLPFLLPAYNSPQTVLLAQAFFLGVLPLIRPVALPLIIMVCLFAVVLLFRKAVKRPVLLMCVLLMLLPSAVWMGRNYTHFNRLFFSSMAAQNLLYYRAAAAEAYTRNIPLEYVQGEYTRQIMKANAWHKDYDVPLLLNLYVDLAGKKLMENAPALPRVGLEGAARLWGAPPQAEMAHLLNASPTVLFWLNGYAILWLTCFYGLIISTYLMVRQRKIIPLSVAIIFYTLLVSGAETSARFRLPLLVLLACWLLGGAMWKWYRLAYRAAV